ncbi:MAG TPA: XRE family transcriptional regulator [Acidimicrobiales bacterium]|nr:XRE family transcriptional regulator [Acidimicrobiales bacterium]
MEPAADPGARGHSDRVDQSASDLFRSVGLRVRGLRQGHHLTLDELSERSGVSRRMITMLEAGEANASVGTLDKLARALDCDFYTMITGSPVAPLKPEMSREVAPLWEDGRGSTAKLLISHPNASTTELWQWELVGGSRYDAEPDPPGSEEVILVSSGHLVVEVADESYRLDTGGYLRVPTDRPYAYANPGRSTARFVRIILMP